VDLGDHDDDVDVPGEPFRTPPAPDDRLWRHPSEMHWADTRVPTRRAWPLAIGSSLAGSILTVGLLTVAGAFDRGEVPVQRQAIVREAVRPAPGKVDPNSIVAIAAEVRAAIVRLEVTGTERAIGSGVLFRDDGAIVTSAHVVEGARKISVQLADGRRLPGRLVGADLASDIAVVRVDGDTPFKTAVFGSIDGLQVGEPAIAIGSPLGLDGPASVTTGVVSALGRHLPSGRGWSLLDLIQTDATIAPGSSGGALLDGEGVVVGITTAYAAESEGTNGLGFATPVDIVRSVATDLLAGKTISSAWLGVGGEDGDGGARVTEVMAGGPADYAGVLAGDVIIDLDDHPIGSMSALRVVLRSHHAGDHLPLRYMRKGVERVTSVLLLDRPAP
jgi:S1-C subfamily serine protease